MPEQVIAPSQQVAEDLCSTQGPESAKLGERSSDVQDSRNLAQDSGSFSVSTTFFFGAPIHASPSDLTILSYDLVLFYVHSEILLSASRNSFRFLVIPEHSIDPDSNTIIVPESSDVLNVILHTIYNLSCTHFGHSLHTISSAVSALERYGVNLQNLVRPTTPLFSLLLSHAPAAPLDVYSLAARHSLHELAVSTSQYLLPLSLSEISEDAAETIGPFYLKRLFFLHLGRTEALRRILLPPPDTHPSTWDCDLRAQKKLMRGWALATAPLAWDARPDMSGGILESSLRPLVETLECGLCRSILRERIRQFLDQWSAVKNTI